MPKELLTKRCLEIKIMKIIKDIKDDLRTALFQKLATEGIEMTYSITKALDEFINVDVEQKLIYLKSEHQKIVEANKLPLPNPYGNTVTIKRLNDILLNKIKIEIEQL